MASEGAKTSSMGGRKKNTTGTVSKLPPIPKGARIQKRPLSRRQHPSSSKTRVIYVSSSTPLMAAVKRVRKQLETAASSASRASSSTSSKNASLHTRIEALKRDTSSAEAGDAADAASASAAAVMVMGTGKAVEKTLKVASFFEQQADCVVGVRTRTVGAVDDVVVAEGRGEDGEMGEDEARVRRVSCLEVSVRLR